MVEKSYDGSVFQSSIPVQLQAYSSRPAVGRVMGAAASPVTRDESPLARSGRSNFVQDKSVATPMEWSVLYPTLQVTGHTHQS